MHTYLCSYCCTRSTSQEEEEEDEEEEDVNEYDEEEYEKAKRPRPVNQFIYEEAGMRVLSIRSAL